MRKFRTLTLVALLTLLVAAYSLPTMAQTAEPAATEAASLPAYTGGAATLRMSWWGNDDRAQRTQKVIDLFGVTNYGARIAGYRAVNRTAVESGATIPLLQSVLTMVRKKGLAYTKYGNGWVLPQTMQWG